MPPCLIFNPEGKWGNQIGGGQKANGKARWKIFTANSNHSGIQKLAEAQIGSDEWLTL